MRARVGLHLVYTRPNPDTPPGAHNSRARARAIMTAGDRLIFTQRSMSTTRHTGGHNQVQHAPVDYRRVPPLPPHTPSTQYSGRRGSSPSGSERSHGGQESDDSGDGSETSVSSEESNRGRPPRVQQVSMAGVFHVHEPVLTNPYLPYNPARYPAYDAHARRVGLEHVRYESTPHEPSPGHTYYRPRTHHYPPPRETPSPVNEPMVLDSPPRSPEPYTPPVERTPSPPTPRIGYDTRAPSPVNTRAPIRQPSPARPPPPPPPPPHAPPEPMRQSPPPMAPFSPTNTANTAQSSKDSDPSGSPAPEDDVTLDMLADPTYPGQKPNYPYPILVKAAILSSAKRRLTLQEIYLALQCRFQWFRDNAKDKAWQNSIRHNLSLNKLFRKIPRDITEPGKGSYWTVDVGAGAGNKRERKRNKRPTKAERLAMQGLASTSNQMDDQSSDEEGDDVSLKATTTQSLSQSLGQTAAFSVNIAPLQPDTNIDPELREGGHVVGKAARAVRLVS
ncbi:hypothetical protein EVJ58_g5370 [Rhodofomes roseus]|uniref:Fork-head domain-containing protein n=2 Tax=Rhodofomes roseus TaxID=34475 RepID=A0A4Y9YDI4_9APHY|nr:hypothetical protein EVJ58_g5370 [Rhodofomes roseus]